MPMYARHDPETGTVVDRWSDGVSWMAHPEETGRRASHAISGDDGVWLFDPLDAPGVDDLVADLGDVAGVAVFSNYHARDAGTFAERHDVPVSVPSWVDRVDERVTGPVERFDGELGASGFRVRASNPNRDCGPASRTARTTGRSTCRTFWGRRPCSRLVGSGSASTCSRGSRHRGRRSRTSTRSGCSSDTGRACSRTPRTRWTTRSRARGGGSRKR